MKIYKKAFLPTIMIGIICRLLMIVYSYRDTFSWTPIKYPLLPQNVSGLEKGKYYFKRNVLYFWQAPLSPELDMSETGNPLIWPAKVGVGVKCVAWIERNVRLRCWTSDIEIQFTSPRENMHYT